MQSDLYCCNICCIPFDKSEHVPKIIPVCSHMLCSTCLITILNKNKRCPFDNNTFPYYCKQIEDFPKNLYVLEAIEAKQNSEYGICEKHRKLKDLVCIDDKVQVCEQCISSSHNNHRIKSVHQLKTEAQTKKKKLKTLLEEFLSQKDETKSLLTNLDKVISTKITKEFDRIRDVIKLKEKEMVSTLDSMLEYEKLQIEDTLEVDETLVDDLEAQISDLDNNSVNKRFLKTLLEPLTQSFQIKSQLDGLVKTTEEIQGQFTSKLEKFSSSVLSLVEETDLKATRYSAKMEEENLALELPQAYDKREVSRMLEMSIQGNTLTINPRTAMKENEIEILPNIEDGRINGITTFRVEFYQGNLTEQYVQALNYIFTSCKKVSQIELWFSHQNFTDDDMNHFCSDLFWATAKIESLVLSLKYSQVSDHSLSKLIKNSLIKMPHLSSISLYLSGTKITDQSVLMLASQLRPKAVNLSHIILDLCDTKITDASIIELCHQVKLLSKHIKFFKLSLSQTCITNESIKIFSQESLSLMKNPEVFELYLYKTQIDDEGIKALCEHGNASLRKTKTLFLNLNATQITDKSISTFSNNVLANMIALEDFRMYLGHTKITDFGIQSFFINLEKVARNLKVLDLNFASTAITDLNFGYFAKRILPLMTYLDSFKLSLSQTNITNKAIEGICEGLSPIFKNLKKFEIYFANTKVTGKSVAALTDMVELPLNANLCSFKVIFSQIQLSKQIEEKLNLIESQLALANKES